MPESVTELTILEALHRVPGERWGRVLDMLESLASEEPPILTAADLAASKVVGLWADRDDLGEGHEFARNLRRMAEDRSGTGAGDAVGH